MTVHHYFSHCGVLQVSKPMNGRDVSLKLVLGTEGNAARPLSINISVQAMRYNGSPAMTIQTEVKKETLQPGRGESSSVDITLDRDVAFEFWMQNSRRQISQSTVCFCETEPM